MHKSSPKEKTAHSACVALAAQVIGDKWTPRLIFAISQGCQRFNSLQELTGGVNPRTLSKRLADLEKMKIISKKTFQQTPLHTEYSLTAKGRDLLPILENMVAWGKKYSK